MLNILITSNQARKVLTSDTKSHQSLWGSQSIYMEPGLWLYNDWSMVIYLMIPIQYPKIKRPTGETN